MASIVDVDLAEVAADIERAEAFQNGLIEGAREGNRDLTDDEWEMYNRKTEQITKLNTRANNLRASKAQQEIAEERNREVADMQFKAQRRAARPDVEYRSAGAYVLDTIRAVRGDRPAAERLEWFNRVAAHQTTTNASGIVPQEIVQPVINFIDASRPLVSALGPRPLEGGPQFFRPRVTTHTSVGKQSAEKAEFASQAMVIDKLTANVDTYGGYVNVSRQLIDWSTPAAMDIVVGDLAAQYALQTENAAAVQFQTAATAGTTLPTGANTPQEIAAAVWAAVGAIYTATQGAGRIIGVASPAMLGYIGPGFAPVNPQNAQSTGFSAVDFGSGLMGNIGGVPIYVSPKVTGNTLLVMSSAAAEVYDQTVGLLSVTEPSVGGVQVAYMGYFSALTVAAGGIIKITKTP